MNSSWTVDPDMTMDAIMRAWPTTISVLIRYRMLCVGCPVATFHTIPEACRAHGIDERAFVSELGVAIATTD